MNTVSGISGGERGMVLLISLILLAVLSVLGITSMQNATLGERMAGNSRDRQLAIQAAESALRAGENYLDTTHPTFDANCTGGFCTQGCPANPRWSDPILDVWNTASRHMSYTAPLAGINTLPRYIIEDMGPYDPPGWAGIPDSQRLYRVTARGTGGSDNARVVLQSTYSVTRMVDTAYAQCDTATLP